MRCSLPLRDGPPSSSHCARKLRRKARGSLCPAQAPLGSSGSLPCRHQPVAKLVPDGPPNLAAASSGGASGRQASRTWRLRRSVRLGASPSLRFTFALGSVGVPSNPQRRKCRVARCAWLESPQARPLVAPSSTIPMRTSQIRSGTHAVDGWSPRGRPASANQVRRRERRFRVPEGSGPTGRRRAPSAPQALISLWVEPVPIALASEKPVPMLLSAELPPCDVSGSRGVSRKSLWRRR